MPKLIHITDAVAHKLDVIRERRGCSYSDAILYLFGRIAPTRVREYDETREVK